MPFFKIFISSRNSHIAKQIANTKFTAYEIDAMAAVPA